MFIVNIYYYYYNKIYLYRNIEHYFLFEKTELIYYNHLLYFTKNEEQFILTCYL